MNHFLLLTDGSFHIGRLLKIYNKYRSLTAVSHVCCIRELVIYHKQKGFEYCESIQDPLLVFYKVIDRAELA